MLLWGDLGPIDGPRLEFLENFLGCWTKHSLWDSNQPFSKFLSFEINCVKKPSNVRWDAEQQWTVLKIACLLKLLWISRRSPEWFNFQILTSPMHFNLNRQQFQFHHVYYFATYKKTWKQNIRLKCVISDVFLPDVCQWHSRQQLQFCSGLNMKSLLHQKKANLP